MSANSFGELFKIHTFGESHGHSLGVIIDGCPAGVPFDHEWLFGELNRRKPGSNRLVSQRQEPDQYSVLSGVFEGKTLGTPIAITIANQDSRSQDYQSIKLEPRRGHADDQWKNKFSVSDHRGGGRSSGRETVSRVIAGAVARMFIKSQYPGYQNLGFSQQIGPYQISEADRAQFNLSQTAIDEFPARFPVVNSEIEKFLQQLVADGDSAGGMIEVWLDGLPQGLGEPVFKKLKSQLAMAVMSVGACDGFSFGEFQKYQMLGTEFHAGNDKYWGVRGGISTGQRISFQARFKPTSSIMDVAKKGRHDPCILIRAIPVVQAMADLVIADFLLWRRLNHI